MTKYYIYIFYSYKMYPSKTSIENYCVLIFVWHWYSIFMFLFGIQRDIRSREKDTFVHLQQRWYSGTQHRSVTYWDVGDECTMFFSCLKKHTSLPFFSDPLSFLHQSLATFSVQHQILANKKVMDVHVEEASCSKQKALIAIDLRYYQIADLYFNLFLSCARWAVK